MSKGGAALSQYTPVSIDAPDSSYRLTQKVVYVFTVFHEINRKGSFPFSTQFESNISPPNFFFFKYITKMKIILRPLRFFLHGYIIESLNKA